jgi:hypothetical protein
VHLSIKSGVNRSQTVLVGITSRRNAMSRRATAFPRSRAPPRVIAAIHACRGRPATPGSCAAPLRTYPRATQNSCTRRPGPHRCARWSACCPCARMPAEASVIARHDSPVSSSRSKRELTYLRSPSHPRVRPPSMPPSALPPATIRGRSPSFAP